MPCLANNCLTPIMSDEGENLGVGDNDELNEKECVYELKPLMSDILFAELADSLSGQGNS